MSQVARNGYPPHADPKDRALFDRARRIFAPDLHWREINSIQLKEITGLHGIEIATAGWCDAVRNAPEHEDAIRAIEARENGRYQAIMDPPTILLVRGAFFGEHQHTGADGGQVVQIAREMGWSVELPEIHSFGTLQANAAIILDHLLGSKSSSFLIVSLSKGSADVALAMDDPRSGEAMSRVCGWVSLSGITAGTPLVAWLRSHWLRTVGVHLLLWSRGQRFRVLDQLRNDRGPLQQPLSVPAHIRPIHVIGVPTRRHLRHPWAPRGYERIAPLGPTDGGGILFGDLARLPGDILPVWGADHYLQPDWDVSPLIRSILLHAARSAIQPNAIPTSKSIA